MNTSVKLSITNTKYYSLSLPSSVGNSSAAKKNDTDLTKKSSDVKFKRSVEPGMNCIKRQKYLYSHSRYEYYMTWEVWKRVCLLISQVPVLTSTQHLRSQANVIMM